MVTDIIPSIERVYIDEDDIVIEFVNPINSLPDRLRRLLWGKPADECRIPIEDALGCPDDDSETWRHAVSPELIDTGDIQRELADLHDVESVDLDDILITAIHAPCDVSYLIRDEDGDTIAPGSEPAEGIECRRNRMVQTGGCNSPEEE